MPNEKLAIDGGKPVRSKYLPYGRQSIGDEEIKAVVEALKSDWITQGPKIAEFEEKFCKYIGCKHAVAVSSGTAALHVANIAAGIKKGDEAITTPFTFAATSNSILYEGGTPIFADITDETYNINPDEVKKAITSKTKAIIPVHFAGQPCDMNEIQRMAEDSSLLVIEDSCHALGANYHGKKIGSFSDMSVFSFHPVKHITTGEGGMITTNNEELAELAQKIRNHGISRDAMERFGQKSSWFYEMQHLGYNYRMTDIQAALGIIQLEKLDGFLKRREEIAKTYDLTFKDVPEVITPQVKKDVTHAWHLYVIQLDSNNLKINRDKLIEAMRAENIGVNVHYIPVHLHPYYRDNLGFKKGDFPNAEAVYENAVTLPIFPSMTKQDSEDVIESVKKIVGYYRD